MNLDRFTEPDGRRVALYSGLGVVVATLGPRPIGDVFIGILLTLSFAHALSAARLFVDLVRRLREPKAPVVVAVSYTRVDVPFVRTAVKRMREAGFAPVLYDPDNKAKDTAVWYALLLWQAQALLVAGPRNAPALGVWVDAEIAFAREVRLHTAHFTTDEDLDNALKGVHRWGERRFVIKPEHAEAIARAIQPLYDAEYKANKAFGRRNALEELERAWGYLPPREEVQRDMTMLPAALVMFGMVHGLCALILGLPTVVILALR